MTFVLAVSQAPHNSWLNGQDGADARQYWIRPTQVVWNGPRIDAAIAGMSPGDIVGPILASSGNIFVSRDPTTGSTYDTVDWTPFNAFHPGTQQVIHGGTRKINKISIYSDVTGAWREEAMPEAMAQFQNFGHWYGRTATDGIKVLMQGRFYYPETGTWSAATGLPGWNTSYAWFPDYGTAGGWISGSTTLSVYNEATASVDTHGDIGHAGEHELKCYHPVHGKVLVVGCSDLPTRVTLISPDASFVQVADSPVNVTMSTGTANLVAHPSGCWLLVSDVVAPRQIYSYWPDEDVWQEEGVIGGPTIDDETTAWDEDRQLVYITGKQGLFAWKLPTVTAPSIVVSPGAGRADVTGYAPTLTLSRTLAPGAGRADVTGYAPIVSQGGAQVVSPAAGRADLTGYAPTLLQPLTLAPGAGSATATGYAPGVSQLAAIRPPAGHVTATGYAPTLALPRALAPAAGRAEASGYAPTVAQSMTVAPGAGRAEATGYAPIVARGEGQFVAPGAGRVDLSGHAPIIVQGVTLSPTTGRVELSGYVPSISQVSGPTVSPDTGSAEYHGYQPAIRRTWARTLPLGARRALPLSDTRALPLR